MSSTRHFPQVEPPPQQGGSGSPAAQETLPLGRLLVQTGAITPAALDAALLTQRRTFLPLGRILRDDHGLPVAALAAALRKQTYVPRVFLRFFPVEAEILGLLDRRLCVEQEVAAFERLGDLLCVASAGPAPRNLAVRLRRDLACDIAFFQAPAEDIQRLLKKFP